MKKLPKTNSPEILCMSSMGNEPGRSNEIRELTPAARALRRREIDNATDPKKKRQLLREAAELPMAAPVMGDKRQKAAEQLTKMRNAAKQPII